MNNITREDILKLANFYGIDVDASYDKTILELEDNTLVSLDSCNLSLFLGFEEIDLNNNLFTEWRPITFTDEDNLYSQDVLRGVA